MGMIDTSLCSDVSVPFIQDALHHEMGIGPHSLKHIQKNTYYAITDDGTYYVCKINILADRLDQITFCLDTICNASHNLSFSMPSLLFKYCANESTLAVFNYLRGNSVTFDAVPSLYQYFSSMARELETIDVPTSISNVSFFADLLNEISTCFANDQFLRPFLERLSTPPVSKRLSLSHGDFCFQNILIHSRSSNFTFSLIDWEYSGVCYEGFDFAWLSTVAHHTGAISLEQIVDPTSNHLYFMYLGYLRLIYRLRSVRHRTEIHLLHEFKVLKDFYHFLRFYDFEEVSLFDS